MTEYGGSPQELTDLYASYRAFHLLVDSRRLTDPERTLFFALPGTRVDGHDFIPDLLAQGVRHFVVAQTIDLFSGDAARVPGEAAGEAVGNFIHTADPLRLLQDLAAHHRQQFHIPLVAVTGSNGKTMVKDWLAEILRHSYRVCASPRSYNSQIGVPLSVWQLRREHEVAVFEAGVSESGEMARLAAILRPTAGVFTMLGSAHAAGFPDEDAKHREKISLFSGADWVTVSADDNRSIGLLRRMGVDPVRHLLHGTDHIEVDETDIKVALPPMPAVFLENAASAVAAAYTIGMDKERIRRAARKLHPLDNRLEVRAGLQGGAIINDSYSNDYSALAAALDFAAAQDAAGELTLFLGTLQTLPDETPAGKASTLRHLFAGRVRRLFTVGELPPDVSVERHFTTADQLLAALPGIDLRGETVLVKGASHERFSRVADALSRQQHRTLLRLDLAALRHNFGVYRKSIPSGIIVMVKASAYGGGALPVARTLVAAGAAYLAVAYPDEGRDLRRGGLTTPVLVLNAEPPTFPLLQKEGLEPVVYDLEGLRRALAYGLRVHLEIDTGMGRLGFAASSIAELQEELSTGAYDQSVASVFTHLAGSEAEALDPFTELQLERFQAAYAKISACLPAPPPRHVLNTNGISRFPQYAFEYVRLGIGLYGIGDQQRTADLLPALRLTTRVAQVYERPAGASVGYNRRGRLERPSRVAVLSIGYADGLPRLAGEGRFSVLLRGQPAPTVGAVCMDMTMVDVTELPTVQAGDTATIFGPEHPIELLAAAAQTIPYEILTGIGPRVHRIYTEE